MKKDAEDGQLNTGAQPSAAEGAGELDVSQSPSRPPEPRSGLSRRQLTRAGVTAPVLMTLFSRPAWGAACSPSGMMSGNASGRQDDECNGQGCTPGFWKNNLQAWQGTGFSPGAPVKRKGKKGEESTEWSTREATKFHDVFGFTPAISSRSSSPPSLLDVMLSHEKSGSMGTYENHLVAALLNAAKAPYIYGTSVDQVISLAQAAHFGSTYEGVQINKMDVFGLLVRMNEAGNCFLNAHGQCAPGFVEYEGQCIPVCSSDERFDVNTGQCVTENIWSPDVHQSPDY